MKDIGNGIGIVIEKNNIQKTLKCIAQTRIKMVYFLYYGI